MSNYCSEYQLIRIYVGGNEGMSFKLDENIDPRLASLFEHAGHIREYEPEVTDEGKGKSA